MRIRRIFLSSCFFLFFVFAVPAFAYQEPGQAPAGQSDAWTRAEKPETIGGEVAHESREAAGEDEQAKFKQSASVKLLARVTNLSLEHAYWLGMIVNFAVVAAIIFWFARRSLPTAFRNRTASIQKSITDARKASEDAQRRLADIESRLSRLDSEIGALRAGAEKEAAEDDERIRLAAEEDARKIREAAEFEIAAAAKTARRELTSYAADLAVALAAKQLHIDSSMDQALVRKFSQQLASSSSSKLSGKDGQ